MLENYFGSAPNTTEEQKRRLLAVQAALELLKATLSDTNDGNGVEYQLKTAEKYVSSLADAIQTAVEKERKK
ncbi:hypothetical protein [Serratia sp. UGAL515B_01]|uniref:hypothetical protein n=1 Tax=Serratia sp. UGAL515B_01 TaxID=2986763 RepID=UPI0029531B9F|nr:hypothetical protein [Serratia sp. UGAL515B_01]WON76120.1 hypothetical protein OK023_12795 [Serratia sp. UGAL515B_01]